MNSLILSKLGHVLRVLSVPKSFFRKLQSHISGFISARRFPRIGFETMCFPRHKGGLSVLNTQIQQSAPQLRWLIPLLHGFPQEPTSTFWNRRSIRSSVVLPLMVDFLLSHSLPAESRAPIQMDYRQAFVFKQLRPKKLIQSLDGVFSLFFTAVDQLPHTFDRVVINPQTALCLTLSDVSISSSSCPLPKSMTCLPSSHAYQVDPTSGRLQPKCSTDIRSRPYLTKHFLKWVRSDKLKLSSFFVRIFLLPCSAPLIDPPFTPVVHIRVDMPPFLAVLFLTSDTEGGSILTSKIYRRLYSPTVSSSSLYPSLPSTKWTGLWRFPLHPQGRNIWYRMLDNKLDRQGSLYMPSKICPICSGHEETPSRFLFEF
ncbi:hypothetical protein G6F42_005801 [Rhizopus arrhizus]|nr:hypothetical protein G6F42_005801 [Rhizopus arrhizus]